MSQSEDTPTKILKSAQKLFVKHGFAATSISSIASLAKVNHSLIFHHFGNKQNLWIAVKQRIVEYANTRSTLVPSLELPLNDFIRAIFDEQINFYYNNPEVTQLINWQRTESENQPSIGLGSTKESAKWLGAFKHYQQKGEINRKLKPEFIVTLICAITSSAALDTSCYIQTTKDRLQYLEFCTKSLIKSLAPPP